MPVDLKITRTTTLFTNDGEYSPGDVLNHTVTISHNPASTGDAFHLNIGDVLGGSTLGTIINVSPIALNDSFTAVGNTTLKVGGATVADGTETTSVAGSVLSNDFDVQGGAPLQVVATAGTTTYGSFSINADGSFTYETKPGATGDASGKDSFTYTVTDGALTSTATVTITITGQVWYVDASKAAGTGDGTSDNPFGSITSLNTTGAVDNNDYIYVEGNNTSGTLTLDAGQTLIGDNASFTVGGFTISDLAADTQASINGTSGNYGIVLNSGNSITGVDVGGAGNGISGANIGTTTISDVTISVSGQGLNLNNGTFQGDGFNSVSSAGGVNNIALNSVAGNVNLGGGALTGATGVGVVINGGNGSVDFNGTLTHSNNAHAIEVQNKIGGTVDFDGQVTSNSASDGILLNSNTGATINFDGGLNINTAASGGSIGFDAHGGGTVNVTDTATTANIVTSSGAEAINVVNTTIGSSGLTFQSVTSSGGVYGIELNNTGASGGLTITGTGTTDGSGGTLSNIGNAGIFLNQTNNVSVSNMTLTNANTNNTVGNDLTIIDANAAIDMSNVTGVTLNNVDINGAADNGIAGTNVGNFIMDNSTITQAGNSTHESGIEFNNLYGNSSISNSTITYSETNGIDIVNTDKNLNLVLNNVTISDSQTVSSGGATNNNGEGGFQFRSFSDAAGVPITNIDIVDSDFLRLRTQGIQVVGEDDSYISVDILRNNIQSGTDIGTGIDLNSNDGSNVDFNIVGNTIQSTNGHSVNVTSFLDSSIEGRINNNTITANGIGNGIRVVAQETSDAVVLLDTNTVTMGTGNTVSAIELVARFQSAVLHATLNNNTTTVQGNAISDINVQSGSSATGEFNQIYLDVSNNHASSTGTAVSLRVRVSDLDGTSDPRLFVEGYAPGATADASMEAVWSSRGNTASSTNEVATSLSGTATAPSAGVATMPGNAQPIILDPFTAANGPQAPVVNGDLATGTSEGAGPIVVDDGVISQVELGLIVDAAIREWAWAGATEAQLDAMRAVSFSVADLGGLTIGSSKPGTIVLDNNAAGYNWFIDATPDEDSEFAGSGTQLQATDGTGAAGTRIDLLTVVTHELGHQIGLSDTYDVGQGDEVMYGTIRIGERRLVGADDAAGAADGAAPVSADIAVVDGIAVLPTYQTVTVQYQSTVTAPAEDGLADQVTGQTTVSSDATTVSSGGAFAADVTALVLESTVFADADRDGVYDAGEAGIAGVKLTLYADTTGNGQYDEGDDKAVSFIDGNGNGTYEQAFDTPSTEGAAGAIALTATTDANGLYRFDDLAAGNYFVRVDASNFTSPGALTGRNVSVTAGDAAVDENVDTDSNVEKVGDTVVSQAIRLDYGQENTGTGNNTNSTLDLGFVQPNQAPVIDGLNGDVLAYTEGAGAKVLDTGALMVTLSDVDSANFGGGSLTVSYALGQDETARTEDVLGLRQSNGITVTDGDVFFEGTKIGTVSGGAAGTALVIGFNDAATLDRVEWVMSNITYTNTDTETPDTAARHIAFTLVDGDGKDLGGADTAAATVTVNITATDDAAVPTADTKHVDEDKTVTIDVLANDTDVDGPAPTIGKVNNVVLADGESTTLNSGATVTLSGGKLIYDPNGAFNTLTDTSSGAVNTAQDDTFKYTLSSGQEATVTVTVDGVASMQDVLRGDEMNNHINGTAAVDWFELVQGGDDTVNGLGDNDIFEFGGTLNAADTIDGGDDFDYVLVKGDYTGVNALVLGEATLTNVESLAALDGNSYVITSADGNVAEGGTLQVDASLLTGSNTLTFNGAAEKDGSFILFGGAGNDVLTGGDGNDLIDGGLGNDKMTGGKGNDTYEVDDFGDTVTELENEGIDRILSSRTSYTLGDNVENLRGMLNTGQFLNGNALSNDIVGGAGSDTLNGRGGNDRMQGNAGNDFYFVDSAGDKVIERDNEGADLVSASVSFSLAGQYVEEIELTGIGNINATGNGLDNRMFGNDGNNMLNGGIGADVMRGGLGNDRYIIDNVGDQVTENDNAGTDRVDSRIDYVLGDNLENLFLTGHAEIKGTGNALDNEIHGNDAANVIDGGAGADLMYGGLGNDRYIVDNVGDKVMEAIGGGYDTVDSSVTYSLKGQYIDALTLTGTDAINGTGNGGNNAITGNIASNILDGMAGDDKLAGGDGNDTLTGGAGADRFVFDTAAGATNVDHITDFNSADDSIFLDRSLFSGVSASGLNVSAFYAGTEAHDANDRIIYDEATGNLFYDADGNGAGAQVLFATVDPHTILTAGDIFGF